MKSRRLLYLSAHQMVACHWRSGELTIDATFTSGSAGYAQLATYLNAHPADIYSLLVNVSEEGFQIETIPFLHGKDRRAIIERRSSQIFFNTALTATLSLGYERNRRKDERVLFAALTNKDFFSPWLDIMSQCGIALAGIHSLPMLAPILLKKLDLAERSCLLLTVQHQNIRQSYFENGELHFSRLTPLQNSSIGGIAQAFAAEASKLQQYLASQRLIGRNQPITAHILAHEGALKTIRNSCIDTPAIRYNLLSVETCARTTGLKSLPPEMHCEALFLHLLAASPPRIQFADDPLRHKYHLLCVRNALLGAGALTLIAGLLFSTAFLFGAYRLAQEAAELKNEAALARQRYAEITRTFPPIPTDHDTLRRVIDRYVVIESLSKTPEGLLREISRALNVLPAVELERIDWLLTSPEAGGKTGSTATPASAATPASKETVVLRGVLKLGPNASVRQMLSTLDQLVSTLSADPKLQVDILQRPLDIESGKSIKGGEVALDNSAPRVFSLQISRSLIP